MSKSSIKLVESFIICVIQKYAYVEKSGVLLTFTYLSQTLFERVK